MPSLILDMQDTGKQPKQMSHGASLCYSIMNKEWQISAGRVSAQFIRNNSILC